MKALDKPSREIPGIIQDPKYSLFMTGDWGSKGEIVLFNKVRKTIAYRVEFVVENLPAQGLPSVSQVELWRDLKDPASDGLTNRIVFEVLLDHYGAIVSDREQTLEGANFWTLLMSRAVGKGKRIGYIFGVSPTSVDWKPDTEPIEDWLDSRSGAWGTGRKFQDRRFVISN